MKILFLLKKRQTYGSDTYATLNSGLYNSAMFVNDMLSKEGISSVLEQIIDDNCIDRLLTLHKPSIAVIEAIHVVPEKFEILQKLHSNVKFIIRLHSELPFLAMEGVAISWLKRYEKYENVYIASNSHHFIEAMDGILTRRVLYFPNYYPVNKDFIEIGVFGAIRPMKNVLAQAVAAMSFANEQGLKLRLHINAGRVEQKGENTLKNIKALFENTNHSLIEHDWLNHSDFVTLVKSMDLCLQVSLSETFNIVAADAVANNVPVVGSEEIPFLSHFSKVRNPKDIRQIKQKIAFALNNKWWLVPLNKHLLSVDSKTAKHEIIRTLNLL